MADLFGLGRQLYAEYKDLDPMEAAEAVWAKWTPNGPARRRADDESAEVGSVRSWSPRGSFVSSAAPSKCPGLAVGLFGLPLPVARPRWRWPRRLPMAREAQSSSPSHFCGVVSKVPSGLPTTRTEVVSSMRRSSCIRGGRHRWAIIEVRVRTTPEDAPLDNLLGHRYATGRSQVAIGAGGQTLQAERLFARWWANDAVTVIAARRGNTAS